MTILGIETSCDETAAAVVEDGRKVLSNVVASSSYLHQKTGGIIPEIAAREQLKCIIPVVNKAMKLWKNGSMNKIEAIAVTVGPGLIGSLLVGVETAKTIGYVAHKPIVPVNHIFAHIYANWLNLRSEKEIRFPAISLVVSGGHTELFLLSNHGKIKWLGGTRDDAAGEAFDKTARILELGFPGGPAIAAEAAKSELRITNYELRLPRPMMHGDNLDFSFSGLKTAVLRETQKLKKEKKWSAQARQNMAYEIQEAITDVLVYKTLKAAKIYRPKSILLGGGVAANQRLKKKLESRITNHELRVSLFVPPPELCTDNAAAIACYAHYNFQPVSWGKIQARPNLSVEV